MGRRNKGSIITTLLVVSLFVMPAILTLAKEVLDDEVDQTGQIIGFPEFGGSSSVSVTVPPEGVVVDARLNLSGSMTSYLPSVKTYKFDNTGENQHMAWSGKLTMRPPKEKPKDLQGTAIDDSGREDVSSSNDKRWKTRFDAPWDTDQWGVTVASLPYQHYEFNISSSKNTVSSIHVKWEGYGVYSSGTKPDTVGAYVYLYSPGDGNWVLMDSYSGTTLVLNDRTLEGTYDTAANDRKNFGSIVDIVVVGVWHQSASYTELGTDHIQLDVTSYTSTYPHDVEVDVNADEVIEHTYEGVFSGAKVFGRDEGFVDELQRIINETDPSDIQDNITVPITFTSSTGGSMMVKLAALEVDTPPRLIEELSDRSVDEDGLLEDAYDLRLHFGDDHGSENLTYQISYSEAPDRVRADLVEGHIVDLTTVEPNWTGSVRFRFNATDRFDQAVESNNITITVNPINDGPVLEAIGPQDAYENTPFSLDVNASDADGDTLTFKDDTVLFEIDQGSGLIEFTPMMRQIGEHLVNITVNDNNGSIAYEVVKITIHNVNDRPTVVLYLPTDGFIVTSKKVKLVWSAEDLDGDPLKYDLYVDREEGMVLEARALNKTEFELTGLKNDTTYEWTVEASDGRSVSPRPVAFKFKVEIEETGGGGGGPPPPPPPNPNQPPTVTLLSPDRGTEVGTLMPTLTWEGYDPDGDDLTYKLVLLDKEGGILYQAIETSSYHTVPQPLVNGGRYFWTVTPSDGEDDGICVSGTWYFTVNRTGQEESIPPVINVTLDPEGDVDIGTTVTFDASASHDPDGTITLYIWTFGDGTTETGPSFSMVVHTFEDDGDFNVSLVIFDDDGRTAIWAKTVKVMADEPPPPPPPPPPSVGGLSMRQMAIVLFITALAVVFGTLAAVMAYRKVRFGRYDIEQIFLVYDDGRLISHVGAGAVELEKQEKQDKEIMGGMLTAVQDFVQHSLKDKRTNGSLRVLEYGDYNIVIERGKNLFLAVFSTGNVPQQLRDRMQKVIGHVQDKYGKRLEKWDGDTDIFKGVEFQLVDLV